MLEADFQKVVIEIAHRFGWRVAHFKPMFMNKRWWTPVQGDGAGFPDLILVRDRILFIELKQDGKYLRPEQKVWSEAIHLAGGTFYVWKPKNLDDGTIEGDLR